MNKAQSIVGFSTSRAESDYYPTPPETTEALFTKERFDGEVWECACGDGRMVKVIEKYNTCYASDIRTSPDIYGDKGIDFTLSDRLSDNIITNPPYNLAELFIKRSMKLARKKVALLLKLVFLEGSGRYELFKEYPPRSIYVFCKRQTLKRAGIETKNSGMIAYAWYVWDIGVKGKPTIEWIR